MGFDIQVPTPERIQEDVKHLRGWISKQPHLPKIDDDDWLETFLYSNKFSLEKTKFKLESYYSLRTKYPEILKNRDPTASQNSLNPNAMQLALSDKLTKDNTRILYFKYGEDAHAFDAETLSKRFFMLLDLMLLDKENRLAHLATVTDFQSAKYLHVLKLMGGMAKMAEIFNDCYSERVRGVHLINFPSFAEKPIELIKKFFPKKIADRFYIHTGTKNTLLETLDEDVVSSDFGGKGPSLEELQDMTQTGLEKHKKWYIEQDEVCSNELLRRKDDHELEELRGSFRKLEVD